MLRGGGVGYVWLEEREEGGVIFPKSSLINLVFRQMKHGQVFAGYGDRSIKKGIQSFSTNEIALT